MGVIFLLDAVEGPIARRRSAPRQRTEILDAIVERMIENAFWIYFTVKGPLPVWMPIVVMASGFITETLQRRHRSPEKGWTDALTRSRMSRALYGCLKMLTFICLAYAQFFKRKHQTIDVV